MSKERRAWAMVFGCHIFKDHEKPSHSTSFSKQFSFRLQWAWVASVVEYLALQGQRITLSCVVFQHLKLAPALERLWALPLQRELEVSSVKYRAPQAVLHTSARQTARSTELWGCLGARASLAVSGFIYMWLKHSCLYPWKSETRHWVTQEATAGNVHGVGRYSARWHLRRGLSVGIAFGNFHFLFKIVHKIHIW